MTVLKANQRGHANFGWLDTHHSFSFGDYYNPKMMGFRALRVINEDTVDGGGGFPMHGHSNMEIITIVTEGTLEHRDTLGTSAQIKPGEVQRMSAGTGIRHSEFNAEMKNKTHLFQIWIMPDKEGHKPSYGQKSFAQDLEKKNLVLAVSKDGRDGSITMNQDASVYMGRLKKGEKLPIELAQGRYAWVQMVKGSLNVNGEKLKSSDALATSEVSKFELSADEDTQFIFFDLA